VITITVITIAHRLSTLRNFDRFLVLHECRLMDDGAPEESLRANGLYRKLVNQKLSRLTEIAA
jgi:ABC-type multidrug transport system fused ATPase/permease subunit